MADHETGGATPRGTARAAAAATLPPLQIRTSTTSSQQQQQQQLMTPTLTPTRRRGGGTLRAVGRTLTKAPRLLGRRMKHFLRDDLHIDVRYQKQPARDVTRTLATLELLAVYHRWLRGVQAFLSLVVFALSLMSVTASSSTTLLHTAMLLLSELTCLVIIKTYDVKAQICGATNVLFAGRNVLTSPFFFHMAAELLLWQVQTPPVVFFWRAAFDTLNYFVFLRLYSVVLYFNSALYVYRTFCRALSALCDAPLSTSFLLRTALVYHARRIVCTAALLLWLTIGCMYAKAEHTSLDDGLWFAFQTLATLGYGDYTPLHLAGRVIVGLAWCGSTALLSYVIVVAHASFDADVGNVSLLFRCHALTHARRDGAARVVQHAWRFYCAQRVWRHTQHAQQEQQQQEGGNTTRTARVTRMLRQTLPRRGAVLYRSWRLTFAIAAAQRTRQALSDTQRRFREPRVGVHTGLSAYQHSLHDHDLERRARRLQRVKDVDRVYLALRDVHAPASSLTRHDVASMLLLPDDGYDYDKADDNNGGKKKQQQRQHASDKDGAWGSAGEASTTTPQTTSPMTSARPTAWLAAAAAGGAMTLQRHEQRLAGIEAKCAHLTELLDALLLSPAVAQHTTTTTTTM